jgi:hypothetical protein
MKKAKGGILFIDEAYGMLPRRNGFSGDVMRTLLDGVTSEEFQGKLIVILVRTSLLLCLYYTL